MHVLIHDLFLAQYKDNGRGPEFYDCFGLFQEVQRRVGVEIPDQPTPAEFMVRNSEILRHAKGWQQIEAPEDWCAVIFRTGRFITHMGTVLPSCTHFFHADVDVGIAKTRLDDPHWRNRIAGYYRYV